MKHMKRILALALALVLLLTLAACGQNDEDARTPAEVAYDGTLMTVTMSGTAADYGLVKLLDSAYYHVVRSDTVDTVYSSAVFDLKVCPLTWLNDQLKNGKTQWLGQDIQNAKIIALCTFGTASIVTNGVTINGIKDMKDQTISVGEIYRDQTGADGDLTEAASAYKKLSENEAVLQQILDKNDVAATVETDTAENVYDKITAGKIKIAVLPEPYASLAVAGSSKAEVAMTLTNAWSDSGATEPLTEYCIVAGADLIEKNPQGIQKFLADARASVEWVNTNATSGNPMTAANLLIEKGWVSNGVIQADASLSEKKQNAQAQQEAISFIARSNAVLIEGENMIAAAKASPVLNGSALDDSLFYVG